MYFLTDRNSIEMCKIMYKVVILTHDMDAMAKKKKKEEFMHYKVFSLVWQVIYPLYMHMCNVLKDISFVFVNL